jgi:hypothetical protein
VTGAESDGDSERVQRAGRKTNQPFVGICLGAQGALSRVLNRRFTPVTHAFLATAAPGQLSVAELMEVHSLTLSPLNQTQRQPSLLSPSSWSRDVCRVFVRRLIC